ncbi:MAG: hypothetical protein KIT72_01445 [Polyangiaceae bacterium]|nr:hypothetical protein [Polyangiaceae bacterium]MCW5789061.1 hypothetical protein [Polyangiaceae bacterium]
MPVSVRALALLLAATPVLGCDRAESARDEPSGVIPLPTASAPPPRVHASSLGLPLPARSAGPRGLLFAGGRLGRVDDEALTWFSLESLEPLGRHPIAKLRAALVLRDGSELLVAEHGMELLERRSKAGTPVALPRPTLLPGSQLFPDRRRDRVIWAQHPSGAELYEYELEGGFSALLPMSQVVALPGYDGGALSALSDGSFVYAAGRELRQLFPGGKYRALGELAEAPWRLLPARRIDQCWVVAADGAATLVTLSGLRPARQLAALTGGEPYDVAALGDGLARLWALRSAGARQIRLWVHDKDGRAVVDEVLPNSPRDDGLARDGWIADATRNLELVASGELGAVAVGGPDQLRLWRLPSGARVERTAPADPI